VSTNTTIGFLAAGVFTLILGAALVYAVDFDGPGIAGVVTGAAVGGANLALGLWLTSRALRKGGNAVLRTMMGGFLLRFFVLAALIVVFHQVDAVDEIGFGITFLIFFMLFLAFEVRLVDKSLRRTA